MSEEAQHKLEAILREVHPNTPGEENEPASSNIDSTAGIDFVAEGRTAYEKLQGRDALDNAQPNEGDVLSQLKRDGSIRYDRKERLNEWAEWLEGALKKYNSDHPNAPITEADVGKSDDKYEKYKKYGVITKEITLPTHLYGGAFKDKLIVPANVPRPKGPRHDTTIFYLSDFTCEGNFPPLCQY